MTPPAPGAAAGLSTAPPASEPTPRPAASVPDERVDQPARDTRSLPPSERPARRLALVVPGHLAALVTVPAGAPGLEDAVAPTEVQSVPALVATHGAGGAPEWDCSFYGELYPLAYVLCPRGVATRLPDGGRGYFYPNHHHLEREVRATVAAAEQSLPAADLRAMIYAGFSQGATMGVLFLVRDGARFPRLLLVEGGTSDWSVAAARRYRASGGRRVAFVCGQVRCAQEATRALRWLRAEGVAAHLEHEPRGGHTMTGPMAARIERALEWLQDDPAPP